MVSTHLKNISQIGNLPWIGVKIKNVWNHNLNIVYLVEDHNLSCWECKSFQALPPSGNFSFCMRMNRPKLPQNPSHLVKGETNVVAKNTYHILDSTQQHPRTWNFRSFLFAILNSKKKTTVDGRAPVDVVNLFHYLQGFIHPEFFTGFLPSTLSLRQTIQRLCRQFFMPIPKGKTHQSLHLRTLKKHGRQSSGA